MIARRTSIRGRAGLLKITAATVFAVRQERGNSDET